ncbi:hypothetical protein F5X99DRAFT_427427 [Biscogniauxia marginata]|nr:hypothetical protein F5X99DRAFT_427427 [Biscogniauxia marginata]
MPWVNSLSSTPVVTALTILWICLVTFYGFMDFSRRGPVGEYRSQPEGAVVPDMHSNLRGATFGSSVAEKSDLHDNHDINIEHIHPLITYTYSESGSARENLIFFLDNGLHRAADFIFILNGPTSVAELIPNMTNIKIVQRPNKCSSLGAHGEVLRKNGLWGKYRHFITLDASVRGPFIPYWSHSCWSDVFLSRVTEDLVGTTANCIPKYHIQFKIWATDSVGMELLLYPPPIQKDTHSRIVALGGCYRNIQRANHAEVEATAIIKNAGYEVATLTSAFHKSKDHEKECISHPIDDILGDKQYYGTNIHPYETIFIEANRDVDPATVKRLAEWHQGSNIFSSWELSMAQLQCTLGHTHPPQSAAGLLIFRQGTDGQMQVFLERRGKIVDDPGTYATPGGLREPGETALACALREAKEELGILPQDLRIRYMHTASHPLAQGGVWTYTTFLAQPSGTKQLSRDTLTLNAEVDDVDWFPLSALPAPLHARFLESLPVLQTLVHEITNTLNVIVTQNAKWGPILDFSFMGFFDKWSTQDPPPASSTAGYQAMLIEFGDWVKKLYQGNLAQKPSPGTGGQTQGNQPNTTTPAPAQQPGQPPNPQTTPDKPIPPKSVGGMSSTPAASSLDVRNRLYQLSQRFQELSGRLQGPPWPNELLELRKITDELEELRKESRKIEWDVEMGSWS